MCEEREEVSVEIIREKLFISECGMFFFFATSRCLQRGCYIHFEARRRRHRYASSFLFCARATTSQQIPFGMKLAGKHNSKASEGNHVCALVPIKKNYNFDNTRHLRQGDPSESPWLRRYVYFHPGL